MLNLLLTDSQMIMTDHVVVCACCEPNSQLGAFSGLEVNKNFGCFVVNAELEARSDVTYL